jgi:hypothetical protein
MQKPTHVRWQIRPREASLALPGSHSPPSWLAQSSPLFPVMQVSAINRHSKTLAEARATTSGPEIGDAPHQPVASRIENDAINRNR